MKIVKGNKLEEISKTQLEEVVKKSEKVHIDIGTGDGRFVFKSAVDCEKNFYIGIDPSQKQLEIYSKKANSRRLENVIFVLSSIENLPDEISGMADDVSILFPWGTLLQKIALADVQTAESIKRLYKSSEKDSEKSGMRLEIIFGYHSENEPGEAKRLELPEIDENYIMKTVVPVYEKRGFILLEHKKLEIGELRVIETSWSKRLGFGTERPFFKMKFKIES